ncbi:MAG: PadR family transcriptional regulator [Planctomycetota bacterium]
MAKQCPCSGGTLDKLVHPAILIVLSRGSLHGYEIATLLAKMPMFRGQRPDTTGVYRCLRRMERRGYVVSAWTRSETGPSKRVFTASAEGRHCLSRWVRTLAEYRKTIGLLLMEARSAVAHDRHSEKKRVGGKAGPPSRRKAR